MQLHMGGPPLATSPSPHLPQRIAYNLLPMKDANHFPSDLDYGPDDLFEVDKYAAAVLVPEFLSDTPNVSDNILGPFNNVERPFNNSESDNTPAVTDTPLLRNNDNPNSSLGPHKGSKYRPAGDIHTDSRVVPPPPLPDNQLIIFTNPTPEDNYLVPCATIERYFSVSGNIYHIDGYGLIHLHERLNDHPYADVNPIPVALGQIVVIGLLPFFVDKSGGFYSIVDRPGHIEPKAVFATAYAARAHTSLVQSPETPSSPAYSVGGASFDSEFGSSIYALGHADVYTPLFSPDSSWPESSVETGSSLFIEVDDGGRTTPTATPPAPRNDNPAKATCVSPVDNLLISPATSGCTIPSSPPVNSGIPAPETKTATRAEIDQYVYRVKKSRAGRRSTREIQVPIECPWCQWKNSRDPRPSELKEHMYAHRGLGEFRCDVEGCNRTLNRKGNLKRHMNEDHADLGDNWASKRPKRSRS